MTSLLRECEHGSMPGACPVEGCTDPLTEASAWMPPTIRKYDRRFACQGEHVADRNPQRTTIQQGAAA